MLLSTHLAKRDKRDILTTRLFVTHTKQFCNALTKILMLEINVALVVLPCYVYICSVTTQVCSTL